MTLLKKSLALVLTIAMIFSTMSVMGYAANDGSAGIQYFVHMNADGTIGVDDGTNGIEFTFKFFRYALVSGGDTEDTSDDVYEWIETEKAAPGEKVKARLYVGTDFPVYSQLTAATMFDPAFFSVGYSETSAFTVATNKNHSTGLSISGTDGGGYRSDPYKYNTLRGKKSFLSNPGVAADGTESYFIPYNHFDDKGLITTTVMISGSGAKPFSVEDWVFELDFTVKNDSYVRTEGTKGYAKTPLELANQGKTGETGAQGLVDIPMYPYGATNNYEGVSMFEYDPYAVTNPAYLSVFSNVTFDAVSSEGGYFDGNETTQVVPGVINEDKVNASTVNPKNDQGKVLEGWSLTPGGEVLKASDYAEMYYGYEDITLYAVWKDSEINTYYTYEVYTMNPDGTYPATPASQQFKAEAGTVVEITSASAPEGFVLDESKANILSGVVNAGNSTILRAYFARKQYTATYHYSDNNGAQKDVVNLYYGQTIPAFDAVDGGEPVVPGKKFEGWSLSETANLAVPAVMPNNNIDIYPMYSDIIYTYVYDANGGKFADDEVLKSFVYKYGDVPANFSEEPVMEGYEFSCWDINEPAAVTEDLVFTAIYNINNYTVTFADKDGKVIDEVVLEYGEEVTAEDVPAGYKAEKSWALDDGRVVEFPYTVTDDVTFTATEEANMYNVTFYVDGEVYESYMLENGSEVIVPDDPADKTGYKFVTWEPDANGATVDGEDLEFNAVFVKGEYVLSFNTDGGAPVDPITATYGDNILNFLPTADDMAKEGYTFAGWDSKLPETMPGENTEVKALWTKNAYSVKFVNGLTGAEITTVSGEFGEAVVAPALPTEAGYTFAWDVTPPSTIPAKNEKGELMANGGVMTITAVPTANDVTITFDTNGGEPATMDAIGGKANEAIVPAIAEPKAPEGMNFVGWDDGSGKVIATPTTFPAESVTLKAVYENLEFEAIYNPNGGQFADGSTDNVKFEVEYGAAVPAPAAPTRESFKFIGWSPVVTTMPAKDVEFTAQWEAIGPVDYTITVYAVNPATGEYLDPITTVYSAEIGTKIQILEAGSTVPDGVTVVWYEDLYTSTSNVPDAANANNVLEITVANGASNNLVAYFKLQEYSVVFSADGGEFDAPAGDDRYSDGQFTVTGTYGEAVELPVEPTKEGYDFIGWEDGETGYVYENEVPAFTGDVDYVAVWEKKTYDVTFTVTDEEGNVVYEETVTFEHGEEVVAPEYTPEDGYEFDGWDIPAGTTAENAADSYSNSASLVSYDVKYVAITGVPEGGAIPADTTKTFKDGAFEVGAATVPAGYTFEGWFINSATGAKADATYTMTAAPVTFYGEFKANTYNINYDVNGGNYLASTPVAFGAPVTTLPVPTKDGSTFKGWTDANGGLVTDEAGNVLDADFTMPADDVLLKATWEENPTFHSVTYTFNIDGIATAPEAATNIQAGSTYTLAAAPANTAEYKFTGWYYNGNKVTSIVMPASDVTIIGIWAPIVAETFTLTLDANGGIFADNKTTNVTEHQANADLSAFTALIPTREGYTFVEWSPALPATMPAKDLTLVAQWEVETYTINFDSNGGSTVPPMDVEFGATVTAPTDPTKPGFEFKGWTPALPSTMTDLGDDGAEMTVTAIWEAKEYPVSLNANGGVLADGNETFAADVAYETVLSTVAPVADPTREGYKFLGWTTVGQSGYVTIPATMPIGGLDYTAAWEALNNTISFDANGGKSVTDMSIPTGETVESVPTTTREGYEFLGWMDESGALVTDKNGNFTSEFKMPAKNVKLTASWQIKSAEVKYEFSGEVPAGATLPTGGTYDFGATVTVAAAPTVEGYTFDGWYNGNAPVAPGSTFKMGEDDVTLTGKWIKEEAKTYTVTFSAAGGKFSDGKTSWTYTLEEGAAITAPTEADLSREGYTFTGWDSTVPTTMPAENLTFSAVWNIDDTRKNLIADANGGEYADGTGVKNHKFNAGDMVDGAIEEPTRDGYKFNGWSGLNADGTMPDADTTIKATWLAEVTIDPNGGKFADGTSEKITTTGDAIDTTNKLPVSKDKATFLGWKDTISGNTYDEIPATSDVPMNLVAQWDDMKQHTVTYYVGGNVVKTDSYYEGDTIVAPSDPTVEGFDFEGWTLEDGSAVPATMGDADLKVIAVLNPHKHNVTFYYDDAKTNVYKEYKDVAFGSEIEVPADPTHPTNPELVFAGWSPNVESEMPDNDLEYVATWKEKEVGKYAAHFIANGETHALHILAEGEIIPVPADPERFGYVFVGWEPTVPETMPAEDITFEAQWEIDKDFVSIIIGGTVIGGGAIAGIIGTGAIIGGASIIGGILVFWGASEIAKNTFTVTYKVDGEVYKTYKVLAGTKIPVPADPSKAGSEFAGWNPEVPSKMPKEDLVFEATWNADADVEIPSTGSFSGIAALATISAAGAFAFIATKKKKEEDEE